MTLALRRLVSVAATTGLLAMTVLVAPVAASSATQTYVVLYSQSAVPASAQSAITAAGGTIVAKYDAIGVAIAKSDSATFRSAVLKDSRVSGVAATARFAVQNPDAQDNAASDAPAPDSAPATDSDSLSGLQWDMGQIHAAGGARHHRRQPVGRRRRHRHRPRLHPPRPRRRTSTVADSANCVSGVAGTGHRAAWNDDNGHGTHTAGTIAAAANGIGIVGVAPNVKIAGIKAGNADGFFFPEAVDLRVHVGRRPRHRRDEQQLLRRPVAVQLPQRRRAAGDLEGRAARDQVRAVERCSSSSPPRATRPTTSPIRRSTPRAPTTRRPVLRADPQRLRRRPDRGAGVVGVTADGNLGLKSFYSQLRRRQRRRRSRPAATRSCSSRRRRRTGACCRPGRRRC